MASTAFTLAIDVGKPKNFAQLPEARHPRDVAFDRRAARCAMASLMGLTTPQTHRPTVAHLQDARASLALGARKKAPVATVGNYWCVTRISRWSGSSPSPKEMRTRFRSTMPKARSFETLGEVGKLS
jgi:hypothetical protein